MSCRDYTVGEGASLPPVAEIREWASSFSPDEIVGRTCSSYDCPLSHALEALRQGTWDIDGKRLVNYTRRVEFVTPTVLVRLQAKVDALDGATHPGIWLHRQITAATFVSLIDEVIAELEREGVPAVPVESC
jgi:hypothetical protein